MTRIFFLFAGVLFFISCSTIERDNPYDQRSPNYNGWVEQPSSSSFVPSSNSAPSNSSSSSVPLPPPQSSSSSLIQSGIIHGTPVTYQGETYQTVVIGSQTWMARNLNYDVSGSKCYNDSPSNCDTYGRLYDWATAMALPDCGYGTSCGSQIGANHRGICPSGWHIPSNADWDKLVRYVDGSSGTSSPYDSPTAGRYLKSTSGWNSNGNGTDEFGFAALPGGNGSSDGNFGNVGSNGNWWSATEYIAYNAYIRYMGYDYEDVLYYDNSKDNLFSVRCLQD
jgi:uncharacterized protein (TIGR02145 family)